VYGRKEEFKNADEAIEVYKFAHKMQIDCLKTSLDKFLSRRASVLQLYELYRFIGHDAGLANCEGVNRLNYIIYECRHIQGVDFLGFGVFTPYMFLF
jgi:hypothetical protein